MPIFRRSPAELPALPYEPDSARGLATRWVQWVASCPVDPIADSSGQAAAQN